MKKRVSIFRNLDLNPVLICWVFGIFIVTASFIIVTYVLCNSLFTNSLLNKELKQENCHVDNISCPSMDPCSSMLKCEIIFYDIAIESEVTQSICVSYYQPTGSHCKDVCLTNSSGICNDGGLCEGECKGKSCSATTFNETKSNTTRLKFISEIEYFINETYLIYDLFCIRDQIYHLLMTNTSFFPISNDTQIIFGPGNDSSITNYFPLPHFCNFENLDSNPNYFLNPATINAMMFLETILSNPIKPTLNVDLFNTLFTAISILDNTFIEKECYEVEMYCYATTPVYLFYTKC